MKEKNIAQGPETRRFRVSLYLASGCTERCGAEGSKGKGWRPQGTRAAVPLLGSFDGLGAGFQGPQGTSNFRNPSDSSLAVGPDHVVQTVNSRIAVYSKKGRKYEKTGTVLYGPVATKSVWTGFGGVCEARNNGDSVVR